MSQMTSLVKAEKAAAKVRVLVATAVVTDRKAQAPTGIGSSTSPAMVDTKMESRVQPCMLMPAGTGTRKRSTRPTAMERARGSGLAPGQTGAGGVGAGRAAAADATVGVAGVRVVGRARCTTHGCCTGTCAILQEGSGCTAQRVQRGGAEGSDRPCAQN